MTWNCSSLDKLDHGYAPTSTSNRCTCGLTLALPASYHSLQVKVEKRFAKGLTVLASYTLSKMMELATGSFSGETRYGDKFEIPSD